MCIENDVLFPNSGVYRAFMNTFEPFNTAKLTAEVENRISISYTRVRKLKLLKLENCLKIHYENITVKKQI